jgi:hypothetical protein
MDSYKFYAYILYVFKFIIIHLNIDIKIKS